MLEKTKEQSRQEQQLLEESSQYAVNSLLMLCFVDVLLW